MRVLHEVIDALLGDAKSTQRRPPAADAATS